MVSTFIVAVTGTGTAVLDPWKLGLFHGTVGSQIHRVNFTIMWTHNSI